MSRAVSALLIVSRLAAAVSVLFVAGTAIAQSPPPPPNPSIPPGPNITAPNAPVGGQRPGTVTAQPPAAGYPTTQPGTGYPSATGPSTAGSSGVLRVMVPDGQGTATPSGSGAAAAPPGGQPPSGPQSSGPQNTDPRGSGPQSTGPRGSGPSSSGRPTYPNDPTMPSPEIRAILEGTGRDNTAPAAPPIPTMRVRARVFVAGQPPVAVLEINGRPITVREGSDIYVWGEDSRQGLQMRVARLTTSEIRLEVVNKDQYFTLN